jgi:hypothetical protein
LHCENSPNNARLQSHKDCPSQYCRGREPPGEKQLTAFPAWHIVCGKVTLFFDKKLRDYLSAAYLNAAKERKEDHRCFAFT